MTDNPQPPRNTGRVSRKTAGESGQLDAAPRRTTGRISRKPAESKSNSKPMRAAPAAKGTAPVSKAAHKTNPKVKAVSQGEAKAVRANTSDRMAARGKSKTGKSNKTAVGNSGGRTQSVLDARGASHHHAGGSRGKFSPMRNKFMLVMAGLTAIGMILLGLTMATLVSSNFFGLNVHKGIELAKASAQIAVSTLGEHNNLGKPLDPQEFEQRLKQHFTNAARWGDKLTYSDILSVQFQGGDERISGLTAYGDRQTHSTPKDNEITSVNIPRLGTVPLSDDIRVYRLLNKQVPGRGEIEVYRYRLNLNQVWKDVKKEPAPEGYQNDAYILVDVAADTISQVTSQMYMVLAVSVIIVAAIVVAVANWFAKRITHPVRILVKDMGIVSQGDLNHKTKPHSNDEIGLLAREFNKMTSALNEAQDAMIEQEKATYELSIAKEVQQQLLPADAPEIGGYSIASYYKGAKDVSGDYYDFLPLGHGKWGFIIADVSGKGIPGSMVMAVTRTIVRLVANKHLDRAAETLKETNRLIAKNIKRGMFVTAFYAVLDERTGQLTHASAGHNPLIIYRAAQKNYELASPKGIAIGFNEGPLFDKNIQQFEATLNPGDSITLYTDGYPEAMNEQNEEYGDDEFYDCVASFGHQGPKGIVEGTLNAIIEHRGKAEQSDDLTMIVLQREG